MLFNDTVPLPLHPTSTKRPVREVRFSLILVRNPLVTTELMLHSSDMGLAASVAANIEDITNRIEAIRKARIVDNPTLTRDPEDYVRKKVTQTVQEAAEHLGKQEAEECLARQKAEEFTAQQEAKERLTQQKSEEGLRKGIHPVILPTTEELRGWLAAGSLHLSMPFVVFPNNHRNAARTGVVETTSSIGRYPDPDPKHPFVWYDIPEAGTLAQSDCQYFNNQGLFAFDCIVVLLDNRFTQIDVAILTNCRRFQIPTYIVRLKADVQAREQFIAARRSIVESNLRDAKLPEQRVYCISKKALLSIKKGKLLPEAIDEVEFIQDILKEAQSRRCVPRS
ncbi:hypothetical protein J3A83DRAFT_4422389 [Scleroderma citrinum]